MTSIPEGKEITRLWKGLDISARKTLGRAVERGEPSPDPALAPLAVALARRTWRQERIMVPVFYGGMVIMIMLLAAVASVGFWQVLRPAQNWITIAVMFVVFPFMMGFRRSRLRRAEAANLAVIAQMEAGNAEGRERN